MRRISELGEKELITRIVRPAFTPASNTEVSIGDDAAVISLPPEQSLVATIDKIPEKLIAYSLGLVGYRELGWYLVAASLSDLAAMGADPIGVLLSLCLPDSFLIDDFEALIEGVRAISAEYSVPILGGDTGGGTAVSLVASALGIVPPGGALRRSGAAPGDLLAVTGIPGAFGVALAYYLLAKGTGFSVSLAEEEMLVSKFRRASPRLMEGRALRELGTVSACQDVSDGIGQTARELALSSNCGVLVDLDMLVSAGPPSAGTVANASLCPVDRILLGPGADFELMFALRDFGLEATKARLGEIGARMSVIGEFTDSGVWLRKSDGTVQPLSEVGWKHFSGKTDLDLIRSVYTNP